MQRIYQSLKRLTKLNFIQKVAKLQFNDESLFTLLPNEAIVNVRVDTLKKFNQEFKKIMKHIIK